MRANSIYVAPDRHMQKQIAAQLHSSPPLSSSEYAASTMPLSNAYPETYSVATGAHQRLDELAELVRRLDLMEMRGLLAPENAKSLRQVTLGQDGQDAVLILHRAYGAHGSEADALFGAFALVFVL